MREAPVAVGELVAVAIGSGSKAVHGVIRRRPAELAPGQAAPVHGRLGVGPQARILAGEQQLVTHALAAGLGRLEAGRAPVAGPEGERGECRRAAALGAARHAL